MKVEVELPPGVYPTDAEVKELLRKFQDIKAATFKFRLRQKLMDSFMSNSAVKGHSHQVSVVADVATDVAIDAFIDLIMNTEEPRGPSIGTYQEGARDFGRELLLRLK